MLLSSIFIYNQVGAIDAIAIERLAMVCELAKRIKDRSTAGGTDRRVCSKRGCGVLCGHFTHATCGVCGLVRAYDFAQDMLACMWQVKGRAAIL